MTHEKNDEAIARISRALDAALYRFARAKSFDDQEDETSNALNQLYRLAVALYGEPQRNTEGTGWEMHIGDKSTLGLIPPLVLMRHKDVHEHIIQMEPSDTYPTFITSLYGHLTWTLAVSMDSDPRTKRYEARDRLDKSEVYATLRFARDAMIGAHTSS